MLASMYRRTHGCSAGHRLSSSVSTAALRRQPSLYDMHAHLQSCTFHSQHGRCQLMTTCGSRCSKVRWCHSVWLWTVEPSLFAHSELCSSPQPHTARGSITMGLFSTRCRLMRVLLPYATAAGLVMRRFIRINRATTRVSSTFPSINQSCGAGLWNTLLGVPYVYLVVC